ncbi:hypothetical protein D9611_004013 [Ephemerocybe angulata]|uniref:N-acetyltransferase domain-containing protein n=1 Tax=Ephemerocybe angulata TaxID=980116 RepID=A0A8H5EYP1_9AGAR|nr:hypothetical protein D9611_004013 [Tulosesus angulatus]
MSAYGTMKRSRSDATQTLASTVWMAQASKTGDLEDVFVYHLKIDSARALDGLLEYLYSTFSQVMEEGRTYPQEGDMDQVTFESYFFAEDVFVGIKSVGRKEGDDIMEGRESPIGILDAKGTRTWEESIAGFYYIKPNYPGRSSHICNGGFVVPSKNGGRGYGKALGKSYLNYAPKLGYKGSVFNLVYVNNVASVRIWESLGFTKAGRIPAAGRLRKRGEDGEEYVDAWVFHKSFV